eukprot:11162816-Lingulodinium_polyedra.AAC.1
MASAPNSSSCAGPTLAHWANMASPAAPGGSWQPGRSTSLKPNGEKVATGRPELPGQMPRKGRSRA